MTGQREDPREAVLRDLAADVGDERPERRLPDAVRPGVYQLSADDVRTALSVLDRRHHDNVPLRQQSSHAARDAVSFERNAEGLGADWQVRPVLFEHAHRQEEHGPVPIERVDLRPPQLCQLVDP